MVRIAFIFRFYSAHRNRGGVSEVRQDKTYPWPVCCCLSVGSAPETQSQVCPIPGVSLLAMEETNSSVAPSLRHTRLIEVGMSCFEIRSLPIVLVLRAYEVRK